jgi:hypothetical protein
MVVEYYDRVAGQPYVRGTFVAHDDVDDLLRQTEPKGHDAWLDKLEEEGIDSDAPKVAREVLRRIRKEVQSFKKQLKPPPPREQDIRLPLFDHLLRDIFEEKGSRRPAPPPSDPRPVSIKSRQAVEAASDSSIRLRATVEVALTDHHPHAEGTFDLRLRCAFDEDGAVGDDCPLDLEPLPRQFSFVSRDKYGTTITGALTRDPVAVTVVSRPYDMDWTTQFIVTVEPAASAGGPPSGGSSGDQ